MLDIGWTTHYWATYRSLLSLAMASISKLKYKSYTPQALKLAVAAKKSDPSQSDRLLAHKFLGSKSLHTTVRCACKSPDSAQGQSLSVPRR